MNKKHKIIKRIIKLLAVASSSNHEGERVSALAMAQQLIDKYNIDQTELDSQMIVSFSYLTTDIVANEFPFNTHENKSPMWVRALVIQTALTLDLKFDLLPNNLNNIFGNAKKSEISEYELWVFKLANHIMMTSRTILANEIHRHHFGIISDDDLRVRLNSLSLGLTQSILSNLKKIIDKKTRKKQNVKEPVAKIVGFITYNENAILTHSHQDNAIEEEILSNNEDSIKPESSVNNSTQENISPPHPDQEPQKGLWDLDGEVILPELVGLGIDIGRRTKIL